MSWPTMFRWLCAYTLVNYTHSRTRYTYTHAHMYITATLLYRTFPFTVNIHLYGVDPCGFVKCVVIAVRIVIYKYSVYVLSGGIVWQMRETVWEWRKKWFENTRITRANGWNSTPKSGIDLSIVSVLYSY